MLDIQDLLKKYKLRVKYKKEKQEASQVEESNEKVEFSVWPEDFLPHTEYSKKKTQSNLEKMEKISKKDPSLISSKKLVNILTTIDLLLIRDINAEDLIQFDGKPGSLSISHLQNKNKFLIHWMKKTYTVKKILKMLKYSLSIKNYNLANLLIKTAQSQRLSSNKLNKIAHYQKFLDNQEGGIFPFEWMLKDCEDSNLNLSSEIASLRFCRIIEKLKEMKNIQLDFNLKEKHKQLIFSTLWLVSKEKMSEINGEVIKDDNLYLIL